ncbi:MAG: hypothetical protein H6719_05955 [Sandaracinaceae bacterium]|nr:hypothetical protein [Sandaracinaceae bacterium]
MKKKQTKEAQEFWALAEKISVEVESWPDWKRAMMTNETVMDRRAPMAPERTDPAGDDTVG